jgi:hypothetical protein
MRDFLKDITRSGKRNAFVWGSTFGQGVNPGGSFLSWNKMDHDPNGMLDGISGKLHIPEDGLLAVIVTWREAANHNLGHDLAVYRNGVLFKQSMGVDAGATVGYTPAGTHPFLMPVAKNDELMFNLSHSNGTAINLSADATTNWIAGLLL